MKTTPKFWRVLRFLFLGFFVVISIGPLIWIIMSSFKSNKEILSSAFALPSSFSLSGYKAALDMAPIFKFYGNSIIISVLSTLLNVVVVSMAASFALEVIPWFAAIASGTRTILLTVVIASAAAVLFPVKEETADA